MSKPQFMHMFKLMGVAKDHEDGAQKDQFNIALSKIFDLANEDTVVVLRQQRESQAALHPDAVEEEVEADRFLQVDEFYVALVRVSMYMPMGKDYTHNTNKMHKYLELLCSKYLVPFSEKQQEIEAQEKSLKEAALQGIPGVDTILDKYTTRLEKIFKQVAASGTQNKSKPGQKVEKKRKNLADLADIDAKEFLQFCKGIRVFDANFSMSQGLDTFVYCNQDEVQKFLVDAEPIHDLNHELKMEIGEFMQAFMLLGATRIGIGDKKKKSPEEYKKKFDRYCDDVVDLATKEYSYIVL